MFTNLTKYIVVIISAMAILTSQALAVTPSPQMIEQFKNLPKSEQQRLARQYGVDPSILNVSSGSQVQSLETPELVKPRVEEQALTDKNEQFFELEPETKLNALKPYGYDIFAGEPSTFAPVSDVPVPVEYLVGPGDVIKVQLYGKENREYDLIINRDGVIQFPELGPVNVTGLTFAQLRESLGQRIKQQMIGIESNITMGELRSIRIFVAGDAYKPGAYTVSSLSSMTQALFVAGGINQIGSLRNIQLKRRGKLVGTLDLYDLLMKGDASGDLRLRSGDVVFIPPVQATVSVEGEVRRPAIYELKDKQTVSDLISMAGGIKSEGFEKLISVERYNENGLRVLINLDLTNAVDSNKQAQAGDKIAVNKVATQYDNTVTLLGAVVRPGHYQWYKGLTLKDLIPNLKSDVKHSADINYGIIAREVDQAGNIDVIQFSLQKVILESSEHNIELNQNDKVIVFNQNDDVQNRYKLNQLVKQRLSKITQYQGDSLLAADLFKAGFEELEHNELDAKEELAGVVVSHNAATEKRKLVKDEVNKMLANLFVDNQLIAVSDVMNRAELLYPVLIKLTQQSSEKQSIQLVGITGQVRFEGIYPLTVGAKATDLIIAAGGLKDGAYVDRAELTRASLVSDEANISHISVDLNGALAGDSSLDLPLQSRDKLNVLTTPDWKDIQTVEIRGEVKFPGVYNIKRGETLSQVVSRAGGYTEFAYLPSAVFVRESIRKQEELEIKKLAEQLRRDIATRGVSDENRAINYSDVQLMLRELEQTQAVGRLVVDLPAIAMNINDADVLLEDQDVLYVPAIKQTIAVMGEVQHPATHRFKPGLGAMEYLAMSGGPRKRADDSRIYVVKADGSVFRPSQSYWFADKSELAPGDTVVVPLDTEYKDNLTLWSQVTQIIYNTGVAFAAIAGI